MMELPVDSTARAGRWVSLWVVALLSLLAQLWICQFFSFGERVPLSLDVDPSNLWKFAYHFPPRGEFLVCNWLGIANLPSPLNPFGLAANLPAWWFFTTYAPVMATLALLAMAAFLRELELPRPAALFGGVVYAWQGDILPFVFPGHYAYIATWPFFAIAAWGALRAQRTRHWAYAVISGASCGLMVGLQPDRGSIASLLIGILYAAPVLRDWAEWRLSLRQLALCAGVALAIALAAFLALFQSYIVGVKMGGEASREQTYKLGTQYSYGPEDTLTYLVPGALGWHSSSNNGPYWGRIGQWPDWPQNHQGTRNLNLAISTTGTLSAVLALMGGCLLLPGRWLGADRLTERQRLYGRVFLTCGLVAVILAWGYHTPFYRVLFELPLMDKWRNPLKWLEWTNFALVVLSAYGVQHLLASFETVTPEIAVVRRRAAWFVGGMTALFGIGLLGSYPLEVILVAKLQTDGYEADQITHIVGTLRLSLAVALVLTALFGLLLRGLWKPERLREWSLPNPLLDRVWERMLRPEFMPLTLALGLAGLSVAQLGWVAGQFIEPIKLKLLTETNPLLEQLRSEGDQVRVSVAAQDPYLNVLLQNQFYANPISCLDISAASRIPDDFNGFLRNLDNNHTRLWFLAGVKNVVVPQEFMPQLQHDAGIIANVDHADGYVLTPTKGDLPSHALVTMRDYLAKATFVPRAEVIPDDAALLKRINDAAWNPRETVLFASSPPVSPANVASPTDQVTVETYTPQEIKIDAQSSKGGYVLVNDAYDPDWETEVNGAPAPVLRADYILRAVPIPAGSSTIAMHYIAHYRVAGIRLPAETMNDFSDGTMLAAWIVAGVILWRRRETESS
jgi:hypothetical protein